MSSVPPSSFEHPGPPPSRPELPEGVRRTEPSPPPARDALPRWPLWSPFAAMLATLVVAVVGVGVIALIVELAGGDTGGDTPAGVTIGGTFVQDVALIGAAWFLAHVVDPPATAAKFGLRAPRWRSAIGWMALAFVGFFVFGAIWTRLLDIKETDDLPKELGADNSTLALVAVAILVCVVAPIAEELFFRGFCFTALRRTLGMLPAAVLTGMIFGAIHLGGTQVEFIVPLMVFGLLLCLLYVWTDSLLPCITLHAFNNSLALGYTQDWGAWTLLAMAGAIAAVLAITLPVARRAPARTVPA